MSSARANPTANASPARATAQGTLRYAARFRGRAAAGHFRESAAELVFSSIGIGTYLGEPDEATDRGIPRGSGRRGRRRHQRGGFRHQLSLSAQRALHRRRAQASSWPKVFPAMKSCCAPRPDSSPQTAKCPTTRRLISRASMSSRGIFGPEDIAAGCHCMAPRYLADQLDRSRRNLGVECVDVFYLHNPETQLSEVPARRISPSHRRGVHVFGIGRRLREKSARTEWPPGTRFAKIQIAGISFAGRHGGDRARTRAARITTSASCNCR